MRALVLGLGLVLASSSAFAANQAAGNGNFRRSEIPLKNIVQTKGITTIANHSKAPTMAKTYRLIQVQHDGGKVSYAKAPLNKNLPVKILTAAQVNRHGLITQAQGKKIAEQNGGVYGTKGEVKVVIDGVSNNGSLRYKQVTPATVQTKDEKATNIIRYVSPTGKGQSLTGDITWTGKL